MQGHGSDVVPPGDMVAFTTAEIKGDSDTQVDNAEWVLSIPNTVDDAKNVSSLGLFHRFVLTFRIALPLKGELGSFGSPGSIGSILWCLF